MQSPSSPQCMGCDVFGLSGVTGDASSPLSVEPLSSPDVEAVPASVFGVSGVNGANGSSGVVGVRGASGSLSPLLPLLPLFPLLLLLPELPLLPPLPLLPLLPEDEPAAAAPAAPEAAVEPIAACWPLDELAMLSPALARSWRPTACKSGLVMIKSIGMARMNATDK